MSPKASSSSHGQRLRRRSAGCFGEGTGGLLDLLGLGGVGVDAGSGAALALDLKPTRRGVVGLLLDDGLLAGLAVLVELQAQAGADRDQGAADDEVVADGHFDTARRITK